MFVLRICAGGGWRGAKVVAGPSRWDGRIPQRGFENAGGSRVWDWAGLREKKKRGSGGRSREPKG